MPLVIISVLIQVAFVLHVIKTGRSTTWIWVVVMLPLAGSLAYIILEILPGLTSSRAGRSASRKIQSVVNPNKEINSAANHYSMVGSVENSMRLADECIKKGLFAEARDLYEKCLVGPHKGDPKLMLGLATSEFYLGENQKAKDILDELIRVNPGYKNQDAHLLYARALDGLDAAAEALHEYETLHGYFTGPDATYYFASFLKSNNQTEKAVELFEQIVKKAVNSSKHYNALHREIIRKSKAELSGLR